MMHISDYPRLGNTKLQRPIIRPEYGILKKVTNISRSYANNNRITYMEGYSIYTLACADFLWRVIALPTVEDDSGYFCTGTEDSPEDVYSYAPPFITITPRMKLYKVIDTELITVFYIEHIQPTTWEEIFEELL